MKRLRKEPNNLMTNRNNIEREILKLKEDLSSLKNNKNSWFRDLRINRLNKLISEKEGQFKNIENGIKKLKLSRKKHKKDKRSSSSTISSNSKNNISDGKFVVKRVSTKINIEQKYIEEKQKNKLLRSRLVNTIKSFEKSDIKLLVDLRNAFNSSPGKLDRYQQYLKKRLDQILTIKLEKPDVHKRTALFHTVNCGDAELVKKLIDSGCCDINVQDILGNTPLHWAVQKKQEEIVGLLLTAKARIDIQDNKKMTSTQLAGFDHRINLLFEESKRNDVIPALTENSTSQKNNRPELTRNEKNLHAAVERGDLEAIGSLGVNGVNFNCQDALGYTALHKAVELGDIEIVKYLLAVGININCKDNWGDTALNKAVELGDVEITKKLLSRNAKKDLENDTGETAIDLASSQSNDQIWKLMKKSISHPGNQSSSRFFGAEKAIPWPTEQVSVTNIVKGGFI